MPVRTCTQPITHMLPDASSPVHLIAGDSSHCRKQCSPSPRRAVITLAAPDFIPLLSLFLQFCASLLYILPFLYLCPPPPPARSCFLPLPSAAIWRLHCLLSHAETRGNYNSYPGLRLSLQIMTSDLCLYHVFSGTLFTSLASSSCSVQHNTAIQ